MAYKQVQAIILAAGKSSRFNTDKTKLAHTICGREMITYPAAMLHALTQQVTLVVGYQKELVREILERRNIPVTFVEQKEQLGTGHALLCTKETWNSEYILVINGDMPLVSEDIIHNLIQAHTDKNAVMSLVIAHYNHPENPYGRIVQEQNKIYIIEAKDLALNPQPTTDYINAGIYLFKRSFLEAALSHLKQNKNTQELYITDLAAYASDTNLPVATTLAPYDTIRGVNTLKELWSVEHIKRSALVSELMQNGVRFTMPQQVEIEYDVTIESNTTIGTGVILRAGTKIGAHCFIDAYSILDNAHIADHVIVHPHSIISNAQIESHVEVGPFARIHRKSTIGTQAVIGNFVEVSKSTVGKKSKAKHLSYIGMAQIGEQVSIGAGTITCNYNGVTKHETIIKDNAFIGSNSCLLAPVTIGAQSVVAAGSVINQSVPENALAIARQKQTNKENYASLLKQKYIASKKTNSITSSNL